MRGESSELTANERAYCRHRFRHNRKYLLLQRTQQSWLLRPLVFRNEVGTISDIDSARVDDKLKPLLHL